MEEMIEAMIEAKERVRTKLNDPAIHSIQRDISEVPKRKEVR